MNDRVELETDAYFREESKQDEKERADKDNYIECAVCGREFYILDEVSNNLTEYGVCDNCRDKILKSNLEIKVGKAVSENNEKEINDFLLQYYSSNTINSILRNSYRNEDKDSNFLDDYFNENYETFIDEYKRENK